jgi:hypothetical protein
MMLPEHNLGANTLGDHDSQPCLVDHICESGVMRPDQRSLAGLWFQTGRQPPLRFAATRPSGLLLVAESLTIQGKRDLERKNREDNARNLCAHDAR